MQTLLTKARAGRTSALARTPKKVSGSLSRAYCELRAGTEEREAPVPFISKRARSQTPSWVH